MKNLRKISIMVFLLIFALSTNTFAYTMYALDGRTAEISYSDADAWRNVGWYDAPVTTMYAPDGRTAVIYKSDVPAWESVGWYDGSKTITIYAADGRSANIPSWQLQSYLNLGWYTAPQANYKNEYAYVLRQRKPSLNNILINPRFSLVYIDEDDIPELIICSSDAAHAAAAELYTICNGKAQFVGAFGEFGDMLVSKEHKKNVFVSQWWGMGVESLGIYRLSNGKAELIVDLDGCDGVGDDYYKINSVNVSRSQYINYRKKYGFAGDDGYGNPSEYVYASKVNSYPLTENSIKNVFGY